MHRKTKRQITESKHVQAQQIHRHRTAGTFFFSLLADAEYGSSHLCWQEDFFHRPCAQFPPVHSPRSSLRCQYSYWAARTLARRRAVPTFSFQPRYSSGIAAPVSTSIRSGLPCSIAIIVTEVHLRRVTPTTESLQRKGEEAGVPIIRRQLRS